MSILQSIRDYTSIEIDDETFEALAELVLGLGRSREILISKGVMVSNKRALAIIYTISGGSLLCL